METVVETGNIVDGELVFSTIEGVGCASNSIRVG